MKKLFLLGALGVLVAGCQSSQTQNQQNAYTVSKQVSYPAGTSNPTKYQIIDQEFENYVVDNDNYDRVVSYEDQINASAYIQSIPGRSNKNKPNRVIVEKTVVDGNGNILSSNAKAPVMDGETLPDSPVAER